MHIACHALALKLECDAWDSQSECVHVQFFMFLADKLTLKIHRVGIFGGSTYYLVDLCRQIGRNFSYKKSQTSLERNAKGTNKIIVLLQLRG